VIDFSPLNLMFVGSLIPSDEIIGSILGASLAFIFSWLLHRWAEKKNRALDLIQEYSSPDFIDIRNDAGKAIRDEFDMLKPNFPSWKVLFDKYKREDQGNQWRKISKIKHFYEKLNYMVNINEVNQKYISGYFYNEFNHWNKTYFSMINGASLEAERELDVSILEKKLKDPKTTIFLPYFTFKKWWI